MGDRQAARARCQGNHAQRAAVWLVQPWLHLRYWPAWRGLRYRRQYAVRLPCILFGHNGKISWGSTAGFGDDIDMFAERVDPTRPDFYWHNGKWVQMQKRSEIIHVKDGAPVTLDVYRTVHGIVMQRDDATHTAYAEARAWSGEGSPVAPGMDPPGAGA
ncbi:penicillin acylase family protein [Cupriavidus basilensis]